VTKRAACLLAIRGQNPPLENLGSPTPDFGLVSVTSFRCRVLFYSQFLNLSFVVFGSFMFNKKPCHRVGKQGLGKYLFSFYLLTWGLSEMG
jgi:hypothetical protein